MVHQLTTLFRQYQRRLVYGVISTLIALGLIVGSSQSAPAISLFELLFRGVQIIQLSTMSDRQEMSLGAQINDELIGSGEGQFRLYRDKISALLNA